MKKMIWFLVFSLLTFFSGCTKLPQIATSHFKIQFNQWLHSKIILKNVGQQPLMNTYQPSEFLTINNHKITDFSLQEFNSTTFQDSLGKGKQLHIVGLFSNDSMKITKQIIIKIYDNFPDLAVFRVSYQNKGHHPLNIQSWTNHQYQILPETTTAPPYWSFQAASYPERPDWVLPVTHGFAQENYQGMNASDYGGGIPVVDLWRKDVGLAVGHLALKPKRVSLPVHFDSTAHGATLAITQNKAQRLKAGETLNLLPTFVMVHQGDFFQPLRQFSLLMQKRGIKFKPFPHTAYQPIWCGWGYERGFTPQQILQTLPKVKELGIDWVVIDDGWQTAEGDWFLNPQKFPNGDRDMRALVDQIHAMGLKAKLWQVPLAADPGTQLLNNHSDFLLLNADGSTQLITWWDSYYLCPAYAPTRQYFKELIKKIVVDWDFDGFKLDGQHQNAVPPCYNPAHHHKRPEESVEALPNFFEMIYETVTALKPDAVVEICPCGDAASFYNMACENQPVASDPTSSWQIRLKGKVHKALMGSNVPYYGDHVELSDGKEDFASTIGIGGVPGTKFVWPPESYFNAETGDIGLTPEKEKKWKKWFALYNRFQLAKGTYLGELYDLGYDRPETHVVQKGDTLFYAFYAPNFDGVLTFRGLQSDKTYNIIDYVNNRKLGTLTANQPKQKFRFKHALLVFLVPQN